MATAWLLKCVRVSFVPAPRAGDAVNVLDLVGAFWQPGGVIPGDQG